jgi:class 3 adenylate cyclase
MVATWGDGSRMQGLAPAMWEDLELRRWYARLERLAVPPGVVPILQRMVQETDVRDVLPTIQAPTLVLHRTHDRFVDVRHARYVAAHVPAARFVELAGEDTLMPGSGEVDLLDEIEEFVTGTRRAPESDRILATVLFTDLVGSTRRAAELGDHAWRGLLARHDEVVRREIERHRGRPVKSLGDGWLATFDGPARAVRCALALRGALAGLDLEIRAGVHTGEVEVLADDVGGLAVHIAARVMALAEPGAVVASQTVKDLVVGSGLEFSDRGAHELRGVPGEWRLHTVR